MFLEKPYVVFAETLADSLLLAIGKAGAINAGLLACAILARHDAALRERLGAWRTRQTEAVRSATLP